MTTTDTGPQTDCTTPKWCAENGCQHRMTWIELLKAEARMGEEGYQLVPLSDAIRAVNNLAIETEARRLTVERLAPWLRHSEDTRDLPCGFYTGEPCDCGLRAALAQEETRA